MWAHPSKIRTSCSKKWYRPESGIFGISSSVRSIWHGSGILYRQLLISLQWDLEIFWDLDIFTSMNFELTVQDPRPMPNCSHWCADSKNTTFSHVPFFHARCSNFRAVTHQALNPKNNDQYQLLLSALFKIDVSNQIKLLEENKATALQYILIQMMWCKNLPLFRAYN